MQIYKKEILPSKGKLFKFHTGVLKTYTYLHIYYSSLHSLHNILKENFKSTYKTTCINWRHANLKCSITYIFWTLNHSLPYKSFFAFNNSIGSYLTCVSLYLQTLSPIRPFVSVTWTSIWKPRSTIFMILNTPQNTTLDIDM